MIYHPYEIPIEPFYQYVTTADNHSRGGPSQRQGEISNQSKVASTVEKTYSCLFLPKLSTICSSGSALKEFLEKCRLNTLSLTKDQLFCLCIFKITEKSKTTNLHFTPKNQKKE